MTNPRLVLIVLLTLSEVTVLAGDTPVGMVLEHTPGVYVKRGDAKKAVALADLLYAGDQIIAETGEVTFLFCPSSERIQLTKGSVVALDVEQVEVAQGTSPLKQSFHGCVLPKVALGSESLERVGGLRARGHPAMPIYLGGAISTRQPVFRWAPVPGAVTFHITLNDAGGNLLWEQDTTEQSATCPKEIAPLNEGLYRWGITALKEGQILAQQSAGFEVRYDPVLSMRSPTDPGEELLFAVELENSGYYAEAAMYFQEVRKANPGDLRLTKRLAWLYWSAGLIAAANQEKEALDDAGNQSQGSLYPFCAGAGS